MANKKIYQFPIDANLSGDNLFLMWADNITAVSTLSGVTNYIANNISVEDIYVTGGTYDGTDIILTRNDNNTVSFPLTIPDNVQNQWVIESANTVTIKTNSQSFIYGDLIIEGLLKLEVNSKLVVLNGDIILNGGSISGDGTTQLVEIPTVEIHTIDARLENNSLTFDTNQMVDAYSVDLTPIKSLSDFGFVITPQSINQNIVLPNNSIVHYPSPLVIGDGYVLDIPENTTLIIDDLGNGNLTGGTYSDGTATFTNNTGGTFNVDGFYTGSTEVFITGGTYSNGTAEFTNNTGGTFNVDGFYTGSTEIFITGGTYNQSNGTAEFTNNTGGTFNVNGFLTGYTNYYTTGATLNGTTLNFNRTDTLSAYTVNLSSLGGSINYANVIFVDATNGNDSTAITGRFDKPCQSIYQASYLASLISKSSTSKALIYIRKGGYYWNGALQNYLDYYSEPGVVFTGGRVTDQSYGAVVSNFYGYSIFSNTDVYISAASTVNFEFDSMSNSGAAMLIIPLSGIANVTVKANYIYASTSGTGYGFTIRNKANVTMNVSRDIEAVHSTLSVISHSGDIVINCPKIYLGTGNIYGGNFKQALILYSTNTDSKVMINGDLVNKDTIYYGGISSMLTFWGGVQGTVIINGNIIGNGTVGTYLNGSSSTGKLVVNGSVSSNLTPINLNGSSSYYFKNGTIYNTNTYSGYAGSPAVAILGTCYVYFNNVNFYNGADTTSAIDINSATCFVHVYNSLASGNGLVGYFMYTGTPGVTVQIHNVRSTKALHVNVVDGLTPTGLIIDTALKLPIF